MAPHVRSRPQRTKFLFEVKGEVKTFKSWRSSIQRTIEKGLMRFLKLIGTNVHVHEVADAALELGEENAEAIEASITGVMKSCLVHERGRLKPSLVTMSFEQRKYCGLNVLKKVRQAIIDHKHVVDERLFDFTGKAVIDTAWGEEIRFFSLEQLAKVFWCDAYIRSDCTKYKVRRRDDDELTSLPSDVSSELSRTFDCSGMFDLAEWSDCEDDDDNFDYEPRNIHVIAFPMAVMEGDVDVKDLDTSFISQALGRGEKLLRWKLGISVNVRIICFDAQFSAAKVLLIRSKSGERYKENPDEEHIMPGVVSTDVVGWVHLKHLRSFEPARFRWSSRTGNLQYKILPTVITNGRCVDTFFVPQSLKSRFPLHQNTRALELDSMLGKFAHLLEKKIANNKNNE